MAAADDTLATLQKMVDGFALDVGRVRAALADDTTPKEAKAILVGALNYVLDTLDMFPDHYQGVGLADDAIVLRLAAVQAVGTGARGKPLQQLAQEARAAREILGDVTDRLEAFVEALPARPVRGRTAADILGSADVRAVFDADLNRMVKKPAGGPIALPPGGVKALVEELRKMVKSALDKLSAK